MSLTVEYSTSLMPFTFMMSSGVLKGRTSMMACARTGPMPGSSSSTAFDAELMFALPAGRAWQLRSWAQKRAQAESASRRERLG
jgi:hypothetical protein